MRTPSAKAALAMRAVIAAPIRREVQANGHIRFWGRVLRPGEHAPRVLRVITLEVGVTVHNAFFDRGYRETVP